MAESNSSQDTKPSGLSDSADDTKHKFREALNRKMTKSSSGSDHKDGGNRRSRAHGPVANRREFRRKSS
ncbi:hypothetical protein MUBE_13540 [Mycobacterium uberis]|uniref:DUF5302 domain-containing protein n=1 Tax=Mycobacterium uberis TaxID=2162698 RepID=A0A3E1HDR9_9MYCO|nr:DUF5302 domain-containing protein [Mycobacterium uberis]RFD24583.1 hypothetical protein MUBE_13540 [Mycobacterium uberis]